MDTHKVGLGEHTYLMLSLVTLSSERVGLRSIIGLVTEGVLHSCAFWLWIRLLVLLVLNLLIVVLVHLATAYDIFIIFYYTASIL